MSMSVIQLQELPEAQPSLFHGEADLATCCSFTCGSQSCGKTCQQS
jgi:hypothetical protein